MGAVSRISGSLSSITLGSGFGVGLAIVCESHGDGHRRVLSSSKVGNKSEGKSSSRFHFLAGYGGVSYRGQKVSA